MLCVCVWVGGQNYHIGLAFYIDLLFNVHDLAWIWTYFSLWIEENNFYVCLRIYFFYKQLGIFILLSQSILTQVQIFRTIIVTKKDWRENPLKKTKHAYTQPWYLHRLLCRAIHWYTYYSIISLTAKLFSLCTLYPSMNLNAVICDVEVS